MPAVLSKQFDVPIDNPPDEGVEGGGGEGGGGEYGGNNDPMRWSVVGIFWSSPEVQLAICIESYIDQPVGFLPIAAADIDCQNFANSEFHGKMAVPAENVPHIWESADQFTRPLASEVRPCKIPLRPPRGRE